MVYVDDKSKMSEMRGSNQHSVEMSIMIIMGVIQKTNAGWWFQPISKI